MTEPLMDVLIRFDELNERREAIVARRAALKQESGDLAVEMDQIELDMAGLYQDNDKIRERVDAMYDKAKRLMDPYQVIAHRLDL